MSNGSPTDRLANPRTAASSTPASPSTKPSSLKAVIKRLRDLAELLHDQADDFRKKANLYIHLAPGARSLEDQLRYVSRAAVEYAKAVHCDGVAYELEAVAKILSALDF